MPLFCLVHAAAPCYTPAAMAATTTSPVPELCIHVLAEELQAIDQQNAIIQLASALAQKSGMGTAEAFIESAWQREQSEPTYLGRGMSLPHARVAGLASAGVCVSHSSAGIPWPTEPAQLIIFLAVPEEQPELYLQLMSRLVRWRLQLSEAELTQPLLPAPQWERELRAALIL